METSDSECFESADEEIYAENENKKSKKVVAHSPPSKGIPSEIERISHLKIEETKKEGASNEDKPTKVELSSKEPEAITDKNIKEGDELYMWDEEAITERNRGGIKEGDELNMWDEDEDWNRRDIKEGGEDEAITDRNRTDIKEEDELNMWDEEEDWEPVEPKAEIKPEDSPPLTINRIWGWDLSAMLNAATVGMTAVTTQVSQGLSNVLETGIGAPDPAELARCTTQEETAQREHAEEDKEPSTNLFGLGNLVSGVTQITKLVETTGNKVILGGLDTLETIGKKTMQVLQDGDPGLKKKRALLKIEGEKPVLSHILREAKEKVELENRLLEEQHFARKANYESLFDDHQGLVHLEALEMLSKQCSIKLERLIESQSGRELVELQETMNQIVELCELVDDDDELEDASEIKEKLDTAVSEMVINISYDKLLTAQKEAEHWLHTLHLEVCSELELHGQAIDTLAQLTALAVERYHKIGELLLIKEHRSTADEADSLVQVTTILIALIGNMATKFSNKLSEKLSDSTHKDHLNTLITNVYFESANSTSYLKNAFQLLIPVLQVGAI